MSQKFVRKLDGRFEAPKSRHGADNPVLVAPIKVKSKILLVDDQSELRALLAESFHLRGFDTLQVSDGAGLQAAFPGPQPDVVLLDLKLPDADGLDLLSAIKRQWSDT